MQESRRAEGSGYFPNVEPVLGEKALLVCFAVAQSAPGKAGIGACGKVSSGTICNDGESIPQSCRGTQKFIVNRKR
jgi:hypothetical protein